jgi:cytidyltransferase-like protein
VSLSRERVGLANGVFDLFHPGHRNFLWEALKHCDFLIVGVNNDESVRRLKGPERPYDGLLYRMDRVCSFAGLTVPFDGDVPALIAAYRPHVLIRGWDQSLEGYPTVPAVIVLPRFGDTSTTGIANERQERS